MTELRSGVARIYSRRAKLIRKSEQIFLGMDEAVAALKEYPGTGVHIGYVDDRPAGGYFFQLFVAPTLDSIVACLAVGPVPRRAMPT